MVRVLLAMLLAASCAFGLQQSSDEPGEPPSSQPTSQPASRTPLRDPVQARIYQELLRDTERPQAKPILPVDPETGLTAAESGAGAGPTTLLEGTVLIERTGRLLRGGDRSEFHFKAGSLADGGPDVMEILKNGLLEAMETEAEAGVKEFIISAEVTRYRERNYLLLRKYRRQVSHGNLTP